MNWSKYPLNVNIRNFIIWTKKKSRNYVADICLNVLDLSISMNKNSTILDLPKAITLLKKVKVNNSTLIHPDFLLISNPTIFVYTDAAYTYLWDGASSAGGHIIFLQKNNKNCILSWSLTQIKLIIKSSTAAKCLATIKGIEEPLYLKALICDILKLKNDNLPIVAIIVNKDLHTVISQISYCKTNVFILI